MVDIHSHFLPCIDDGAKSAKESISMLTDSFMQGVDMCVATPHVFVHKNTSIDDFIVERQRSAEILHDAFKSVKSENIKLPELRLGAEVFMDNDISLWHNLEKLCIEGTNLMLVELPTDKYTHKYSEWLYLLTLKGILPVIAHIERYPFFGKLYDDISGFNIVYQVNARTVTKTKGRKLLEFICKNGETVLVSSDMHNLGLRKNCMKKAYESAKKHLPDYVNTLFRDNAMSLLNNK